MRTIIARILSFTLCLWVLATPRICNGNELISGNVGSSVYIDTFDLLTNGDILVTNSFQPDGIQATATIEFPPPAPEVNHQLFGLAILTNTFYYTVLNWHDRDVDFNFDGVHACPYGINGSGGSDFAIYKTLPFNKTNAIQSLAVHNGTVYGLSGFHVCHPEVFMQLPNYAFHGAFIPIAKLGDPAYTHVNEDGADHGAPWGFIVLPTGSYLVQDTATDHIFREYRRNGVLNPLSRVDLGSNNAVYYGCLSESGGPYGPYFFQENLGGIMATMLPNPLGTWFNGGGFGNFPITGIATTNLVVATNILAPYPIAKGASLGDADSEGAPTNSDTLSSAQRSQQVYSSSQFPPTPIVITGIHFRPSEDPYVGPFSTTISNIQINLSTTTNPPDGLSTIFANNVGADDTIVYSNAPLVISSSYTGDDNGPRDADIYIPLQEPFSYDPSMGNLLLDIRHFSDDSANGVTTSAFDGTNDAGSRVMSSNPYATTATTSDSIADVVYFTYYGPNTCTAPNYGTYTATTNVSTTLVTTQRVQQVYQALQFPTDPILITALRFRPAESPYGSAFSNTISDIQINLSTTTNAPDALSMTFSNNVGADDKVVYSGALTVSSAFTGSDAGPKDSDIIIPLQTPFAYFPTNGNLLLDIRHFSDDSGNGAFTSLFYRTNDCGSRVMSSDPNASSATLADSGIDGVDFIYQGGGAIMAPSYAAHSSSSDASHTLTDSIREQQVYGASQFPPIPVKITELRFRPAQKPYGGVFSTTISSIQINLSTTTNSADSLSSTFADNVGTNDTVVYNGSVQISSAYTGDNVGPRDNDIVIRLQTPFIFDPSQGNLLLDIRHFSNDSSSGAYVEDFGESDDAGSRAVALSPYSTTASFTDSGADVIKFIYTDQ